MGNRANLETSFIYNFVPFYQGFKNKDNFKSHPDYRNYLACISVITFVGSVFAYHKFCNITPLLKILKLKKFVKGNDLIGLNFIAGFYASTLLSNVVTSIFDSKIFFENNKNVGLFEADSKKSSIVSFLKGLFFTKKGGLQYQLFVPVIKLLNSESLIKLKNHEKNNNFIRVSGGEDKYVDKDRIFAALAILGIISFLSALFFLRGFLLPKHIFPYLASKGINSKAYVGMIYLAGLFSSNLASNLSVCLVDKVMMFGISKGEIFQY